MDLSGQPAQIYIIHLEKAFYTRSLDPFIFQYLPYVPEA